MVENVRGQCGRAAVTRVASSRVELRACRVLACRGVHVVGVNPCAAPAPCPAHYGLCVPVVVTLTDATNGLGTVQPDEEAILKIVEANRKKVAAKRAAKAANQEDRTVPELVDVPSTSPPATVVAAQPKLESQPSGVDVEGIVEAVERWVRGPGEEEQVESAQQKEARQYKELVGTLAELAAEKRAGRVAPGPEPPTGTPRHHETVQLFSELMQTDDVSTIAAHIANKAELIYQTWKRTGLNPTELIQYHTPLPRGEQASDGETSPSGPPSATAKPRTPVRNISPAPPGSSPAVSRKFIEPALHNGRPHATSPVRTLNASPRPYIPPGTSPHSPSAQPQSPPVFPSSNGGSSPHQSPRLLYSSPASPSLSQTQGNSRPYVTSASPQSPRGSLTQPPPPPERSSSYPGVDSTQQQQEGPYDIFVDSNLETSLQELVKSFVLEDKARHHAAAVAALASQRPKGATSSIQEALQKFERQMVITSRSVAHSQEQPGSPPPPLGTMGRFAQMQMQQQQQQQQQLSPSIGGNSMSMSSNTSSSSVTISTSGRRYGGTRSDSAMSTEWSRMQAEHDSRSRRSASPNPPVSQPGWNETSPPNTSTWPLKNKQPMVVERKSSKHSASASGMSSSASSSSFSSSSSSMSSSNVSTSTNYITTLEARVESSGQKSLGVPLRHKVVAMSAVDQEEERLMHALRTGTLIDDGEHLRPLSQSRPIPTPSLVSPPHTSPVNSTIITGSPPSSDAAPLSPNSRKAKYSISVTVDVDKPIEVIHQGTHQQHHIQNPHQIQHHIHHQQQQQLQHQLQQQLQLQQQQQQHLQQQQQLQHHQQITKLGSSRSIKLGKETEMSMVDSAKLRYQESLQHPHSLQRLDDHRSMSTKQIVNGDGHVMKQRTRFENGNTTLPDSISRGALGIQADEVGSTLPEFYRRKLRKMRKAGSPEPSVVGSISALPHPELTDQQKAHIRERSQSPTAGYNSAGVAIRPFLTQGSVAERVLIFERAPAEMKPKPGAPPTAAPAPEKRRLALSTWREPNEVRSMAQFWNILSFLGEIDEFPDGLQAISSPTSPPSPARQTEPPVTAEQETKPLTYVREGSAAQKENARPLPSSGSTSPVSPLSQTTTISPLAPTSPTPTTPPLTTALQQNAHPASPASPVGPPGSTTSPLHPARVPNTLRRHNKSTKNLLIPRFYYPMGRPSTPANQEQALSRVSAVFREQNGQVMRDNMDPLMRACGLPLYWKAPLFIAAGGDKLGYLTQEQFSDYWSRVISTCHDTASRFVRVLTRGMRNYLLPEDFLSMIQDVVDTHPGLTFLKEATEFHSRYVHTVIARIYYCVNRSWSGRITLPELRRSNLLQVISILEEEEDINQITDYFSYEHFYVIYCKFWELDTDHDLFIDKHDLAKHNERALSWRMIERIFSGAVTRGRLQKQDRMGYQEFVWFLISEEDKRHPTAIEYWFRCMDLDGDGYLSMYELEYFYEEQLQRMEALGIETLPFHDCLCQMLDMVRPEENDKISLRDLKKCRMTPIFFDTFFNLEKYLDHEQRDPFASHRAEEDGSEQVSDWNRYAAEEYELLVAEEGGAEHQDDMFYGEEDELSMGCEDALDSTPGGGRGSLGGVGSGGALNKHSPLSATVTNLAADPMDVDDDYPDYADSDDYQY
ncbi:uncharacterized protein LOC123515992 isoform X3 [Portunus trituberculatus]|uniref:uncharacterized protein LOC123515992 isoform X3 n=1 Tax=Portunus trituberculatus TaxID=210409 RepID=UPI001E1CC7FE|nr:uncharacterized protein LOC123515992 isoform X3 [Portunus trituberculatus]